MRRCGVNIQIRCPNENTRAAFSPETRFKKSAFTGSVRTIGQNDVYTQSSFHVDGPETLKGSSSSLYLRYGRESTELPADVKVIRVTLLFIHSLTNQSGTIHTTSCVSLTFNTEVKPASQWKTTGPRRPGLSPDASLRGFTPRASWSWRLSHVCRLTPNTLRCERPGEVETSDADLWTRTEAASTTSSVQRTVSSSSSDRFLIWMCCREIKTVNLSEDYFT